MAIYPINTVQGAPRQPLPYGLFSVVDFPNDGRWEGAAQWDVLTKDAAKGRSGPDCNPAPPQLRGASAPTVGLPKVLDAGAGDTGTATSFAVYGMFNCTPVGFTVAQSERLALEHLQAREEARVEQAFWTGDLGNVSTLKGATVLNAGVAVSPLEGLGLLEEWIAANYGSLGVIHMTKATATVYETLQHQGNRLLTPLGTPIVAGAGYDGSSPAGAAAGAGNSWAYVTPAMFGRRSEVFTSSGIPGDLLDRDQNNLYALAERNYLIGFDPVGAAAILIDRSI